MRGSARGYETDGHLLKKWYKPITLGELRAYAAKHGVFEHGVFDAEGKKFEPSTDKSAPDFESKLRMSEVIYSKELTTTRFGRMYYGLY